VRRRSRPRTHKGDIVSPNYQKYGGAREAICTLLAAAQEPLHVKEIAQALGKSEDAIYVWFSANHKIIPQINKVARGTYSWKGASE
jgi:hypothetical protein